MNTSTTGKAVLALAATFVASFALLNLPRAAQGAAPAPVPAPVEPLERVLLKNATDRLRSATAFRMVSTIDQTLIPRAVQGMAGQQDQTLTLQVDGEVSGPDQSRTTITLDPGKLTGLPDLKPVTVVRDGTAIYAERDGQRVPYQGDGITFAPVENTADYLAAASSPRMLEPRTVGGVTYQRVAFLITGEALAREMAQSVKAKNPGALTRVPDSLRHSRGSGEIWITPDGLIGHQIINIEAPNVSDHYDGRMAMRTDFSGWVNAAPGGLPNLAPVVGSGSEATSTAQGATPWTQWMPPSSLLFAAAILLLTFGFAVLYRRNRRVAYALMAWVLSMLLGSTSPLRAVAAELSNEQRKQLPSLLDLLGVPAAAEASAQPAALQPAAAVGVPQVLKRSAPLSPLAFGDPIQVCGAGLAIDTDRDGITDLDESCLGTNPYLEDSDEDGLPDGFEITPTTIGSRQWVLNPAKVDSNSDGIPDLGELPSTPMSITINGVLNSVPLGNAPVNAAHGKRADWDNDGIPNTYDDDNDGDGVVDSLDISPYSVGTYGAGIGFQSSVSSTFTGTQYLELQFQPRDEERLRYSLSTFQWALNDHEGAMQNRTNTGLATLNLIPMLEVDINAAAAPRVYSGTTDYNLSIREEPPSRGKVRFYAPVQLVGNGGAARAFASKIAFSGAEARNIDLDARLVWFVSANTQNNAANPSAVESTILTIYRGDQVRVTGMTVSLLTRAEAMMVGHPSAPNDHQYLLTAAVGLNSFFLGMGIVPTPTTGLSTLVEAAQRFTSTNTATMLRMGVPTTVALKAQTIAGPHTDAVIAAQGRSINAFLNNNGFDTPFNTPSTPRCDDGVSNDIKCTLLLFAIDEHIGELGLDDAAIVRAGASAAGSQRYSVNLRDVPIYRRMSTKMQMLESLGNTWRTMALGRTLAVLHNRYGDQRSVLEPLVRAAHPNKSWEGFLITLFATYYQGLSGLSTTGLDSESLFPDAGEVSRRLSFISGLGGVPSLVRVVADLQEAWAAGAAVPTPPATPAVPPVTGAPPTVVTGVPGGSATSVSPPTATPGAPSGRFKTTKAKFEFGFNIGQAAISVLAISVSIAAAACGDEEEDRCDADAVEDSIVAIGALGAISSGIDIAYKSYQIATRGAATLKDTLPALGKFSTLSGIGKAAVVTAVVGFAITAAVAIAELVLTIGSVNSNNLSSLFTKEAIANFIGIIVWALIQLVLAFVPGVGQIIAAILGFIDALVTAITGGESTASQYIVKFFYDVDIGTELTDQSFGESTTSFLDGDKGLVAGNTVILSTSFTGEVEPLWDDYERDWLNGSTVYGRYQVKAVEDVLTNLLSGNLTAVDFRTLPNVTQTSKNCTVRNWVNRCSNDTSVHMPLVAGPNKELKVRAVTDFKYAVHECGLLGAICYDPDYTTTTLGTEDEDGNTVDYQAVYFDVLPATVGEFVEWNGIRESRDAWNRDRDGDGISTIDEDRYKYGNPGQWDTDRDGLSDKFELDNGLNANKADTDRDGVRDGDEVYAGLKAADSDTDDDGLVDGLEFPHLENNTYVLGGWDVTLPSGRVVRVFSDPFNRDFDNDRVLDGTEREQAKSPWAVHVDTTIDMGAEPYSTAPDNSKRGLYVGPGQKVTFTVSVLNYLSNGFTSTLSICVPSEIINLSTPNTGGTNHAPPAATGVCAGGTRYALTFGSPNTLLYAEQIDVSVNGTVAPSVNSSKLVTATAQLQFPNKTATVSSTVYIDATPPEVGITSPNSGVYLGRGPNGSTYIAGGFASDDDTWVSRVEINTGGGFTNANGTNSWQAAWTLPADGVYTLQARAFDFVGRQSAVAVITNAIVDGTAPVASLTIPPTITLKPQISSTLFITGTATDNLAGLTAVEVSIDGGPYRLMSYTPGLASTATYSWFIPALNNAQGLHTIVIRARDNSGNISAPYTSTVFIDSLPPDSNLITRDYVNEPLPLLRSNTTITLYGRSSELGYHPLPPSPAPLQGTLNTLTNATVLYGADRVGDVTNSTRLAWMGDVNADRYADFVAGMPVAANGAGRVNIVYGKTGNFQPVPLQERIADSRAAFTGEPGAGIGQYLAPVGDVNADGYNDLLVGDAVNNRAFLIYGRVTPLGNTIVLSNGISGVVNRFTLALGGNAPVVAPAGDVNADGFDDMFVGASGGSVALVMGRSGFGDISSDPFANAATTMTLPVGGRVTGVGDVNGDGRDDFLVSRGTTVSLYLGSASFVRNGKITLPTAAASFTSGTSNASLMALGDINGDKLADFAFANGGGTVAFVYGRTSVTPWAITANSVSANSDVVAVGDVNADGRADFLLRDANLAAAFEMRLYFGAATPTPTTAPGPTIVDVFLAAAAPFGAGANLNCDASTDLLFLPKTAPASPEPNTGLRKADNTVSLLPLAPGLVLTTAFGYQGTGLQGQPAIQALIGGVSAGGAIGANNVIVDDDYCNGCGNDGLTFGLTAFADIQSAINTVAAGSRINVLPGVYAGFTINAKNNLTVIGVPTIPADPNRVGAETIFVDGAGGAQVVLISNATGVRVSGMLLRNAGVGINLTSAGVGGSATEALQTKLDRLIVYSATIATVQMTRDSTAWIERATLTSQNTSVPIFNITGSADATPANKLKVTNVAIVAPAGAASYTWFVPSAPMADFTAPTAFDPTLLFVRGTSVAPNTVFTPTPTSFAIDRNLSNGCGLPDELNGVYRFNCQQMGFHADRPLYAEAYVSPDMRTGVPSSVPSNDPRVFRSIQAAIRAGYKTIYIAAGRYQENLNLADGVQLVGSSATETTLELPPGSTRPLIQADGVRSATLTGLTLSAPGGTAFSADGGARVTLRRNIIRDSATGVAISGASTQIVAINNTFVRNIDAFAASNNASFNLRNNGFVQNSGTALSFQNAATTRQHEYNAYYLNTTELRIDGAPMLANGSGEIAADPLFNNATANDFRLRAGSGWIDKGSPSDPTPPGTGDYADIGYAESRGAALYVSPTYCYTCANDGLTMGKNAFNTINSALVYAYQNGMTDIDISVGAGAYLETVFVGVKGVRLIGQGADATSLISGGTPFFVESSDVEISGFRLSGNPAAVVVRKGARNFTLSRSIIQNGVDGVVFDGGASGRVLHSTIAGTGVAVRINSSSSLVDIDSSLITHNSVAGAQGLAGTLRVRYSLFFSNATDFTSTPISTTGNVIGQDPLYIDRFNGNYQLNSASPAIDAGNPATNVFGGGGTRADMGYRESLGRPFAVLFGTVGTLCTGVTAGVAAVEYGVTSSPSISAPLTSTLPSAWQAAGLSATGQTAANWQTTVLASGDGLRRLYSRATDVLGNQEKPTLIVLDNFGKRIAPPVLNVYDGAFYVDGTAPGVGMEAPVPFTRTIARNLTLLGAVTDTNPLGQFTANTPYFMVNGQYVPGQFIDTGTEQTARRFTAQIALERGGLYTITAHASDSVGFLSGSSPVTAANTLSAQPLTPTLQIIEPISGSIMGAPPTITLRGTIAWTHPEQRNFQIGYEFVPDNTGCEYPGSSIVNVTFDDPFGMTSGWQAKLPLPDFTPRDGLYQICVRYSDANSVGNTVDSIYFTYDETGPTFTALTPSKTITTSVPLTGTVVDDILTTYVDRVEMSLDNGGSWSVISQTDISPPTITRTSFSSIFVAPDNLDAVPLPVLFRAWDRYGNSTITTTTMTVDNVAPRFTPPTFNLPPGTHLSTTQNLVVTWTNPTDGSGVFTVTSAINTLPVFTPTTVTPGGAITVPLNSDNLWYAHVNVTDPAGNTSTYSAGPWYADLNQFCDANNLRLTLDGTMDLARGEWRSTMFLDDDERPWMANPNGQTQRLYAQWDKNAFYVGWDGSSMSPGIDGNVWVYLNSGGAGSTALITGTANGNSLPFAADTAIVINSPASGTLYRFNGSAWTAFGPISTTTGSGRQTEARIPFVAPLTSGTVVRMLAYQQALPAEGASTPGAVTSMFPTTNPLDGAWTTSYTWSPICAVNHTSNTPANGQPSTSNIAVSMVISESNAIPYGRNQQLTHIITIRNYETRPQSTAVTQTLQIVMTPTTGLSYAQPTTTDTPLVCCGVSNGHYHLPALPVATGGSGASGAPGVVTVTQIATIASVLSGVDAVTSTLRASINQVTRGTAVEARRLDLVGPTVTIDDANTRPGAKALNGTADDGDGIGVALVEVNVNNGGWQPAASTGLWYLATTVPASSPLNVRARATDQYGQVGPETVVNIVVDDIAPTAAINPPSVFTSTSPTFLGTAFDPPSGGPLQAIEVLMTRPGSTLAVWQPVIRTTRAFITETTSPEPWRFWPGTLAGDGITITVQPRAIDAAGNIGYGDPKQVLLDTLPPQVTVTLALTNVVEAETSLNTALISGTVTDGSGVRSLQVRVYDPLGNVYTDTVTVQPDGSFVYRNSALLIDGRYSMRLFVTDNLGNESAIGPFNLFVGPILDRKVYLPISAKMMRVLLPMVMIGGR